MNNEIGRAGKRLMQYVWDPPPKNEDDSPIWCLGQCYESHPLLTAPDSHTVNSSNNNNNNKTSSDGSSQSHVDSKLSTTSDDVKTQEATTATEDQTFEKIESQHAPLDDGWPAAFLDDFETKIWLTYRSDFTPIPKSTDPNAASAMSFSTRLKMLAKPAGFNSDTDWGCMIRSGQSMLANTLALLEFGRDWRKGQKQEAEAKLLSLFADDPNAPFSIHRFVEHGAAACGKHPGEWFGPSATARCIQALTSAHSDLPSDLPSDLRVYVRPDDSDIYEDAFLRTARDTPSGTFHPTLILLGTRLGIDRVTPAYWASLAQTLSLPQSVGIAGGKPSSSHYFVGVQGQRYFYLDPHFTRPRLPVAVADADRESCHTRRLRWCHVTQMDPSMLLGFLIRSEDEWRAWRSAVSAHGGGKAVVHVHDVEPRYSGTVEREGAVDEVQSCDESDDDTVVC